MAEQPNPYAQPNNTWVSLSGEVRRVERDFFHLDFGDGLVIVEMDDGDRDADGYKLLPSDKVKLNGRIDDDFLETTKIEASSVYVEKLDTYFYPSSADEEDFTIWYTVPVVPGQMLVQGVVSEVNGDEFVVNTGLQAITVTLDSMACDPLDDEGYQKIDVGDLVRVSGEMQETLFGDRELEADEITKIAE